MGMDITIFEVVKEGKEFCISGLENIPEWMKPFIFEKDVECVDVEKWLKDKGYNPNDVTMLSFSEDNDWIFYIEGVGWIKASAKELDKYKYKVKEKFIKVKELFYRGYGYCCDYFRIHPFFEDEKAEKYTDIYYFEPEQMEKTKTIFKDEYVDRWNEVMKKFRELKEEGKNCFVYVSW